ncbi:MAG: NapC/NirT family cytochrome c [Elusimicrobiota bacterium]|jgi:cytochrome c nitrite reductase small subunit
MPLSQMLRLAHAYRRQAAAAALAGAALGIFLLFGPPKLLEHSESPAFCAACHIHGPEYEAFIHAGAHRRLLCVDCHLPNDNIPHHFVWKSIDGMKDAASFYGGLAPEDIRLSAHGSRTVQDNCIRCHATMAQNVNPARECWQCHRRMAHKTSSLIESPETP